MYCLLLTDDFIDRKRQFKFNIMRNINSTFLSTRTILSILQNQHNVTIKYTFLNPKLLTAPIIAL